jgi:hypothetical protein
MDRLTLLLSAPPPSVMWLAVLLSFCSIVLQVLLAIAKGIGYRVSRRDRRFDGRAKVEEKWFETVVIDRALPQILSHLDQERAEIKPLTKGEYQDFNNLFAQRAETLKGRLVAVSVLSVTAHDRLLRAIDNLSDAMTNHCAGSDDYAAKFAKFAPKKYISDAFDHCQNECIEIMRAMHVASLSGPNGSFWRRIRGSVTGLG